MENKTNKFQIISFYRFIKIEEKKVFKKLVENLLKDIFIRGTILIASEGLNGSISGKKKDLNIIIKFIRKKLKIRNLNIKINEVNFLPFNKIKIRIKNEIVSLGKGNISYKLKKNNFINPSKWNNLIKKKDLVLIDLRNEYEINVGRFRNSINPKTKSFSEFPSRLDRMNLNKDDNIAMYCTGGIRCEKASNYLKQKGYKNIFQLKGGILNYLKFINNNGDIPSKWDGECFVFDNRVSVNKELKTGKYIQCHGCRHPLSKKDTRSNDYTKGVSCPYCIHSRTEEQKKNSLNRQKQINNAEMKSENHPFKRIKSL